MQDFTKAARRRLSSFSKRPDDPETCSSFQEGFDQDLGGNDGAGSKGVHGLQSGRGTIGHRDAAAKRCRSLGGGSKSDQSPLKEGGRPSSGTASAVFFRYASAGMSVAAATTAASSEIFATVGSSHHCIDRPVVAGERSAASRQACCRAQAERPRCRAVHAPCIGSTSWSPPPCPPPPVNAAPLHPGPRARATIRRAVTARR